MPRALRSGGKRVLGSHDGTRGRRFHAHYKGLTRRWGPLEGLVRDYASATAGLFVTWWDCQEALEVAQRQRRDGRGRRPAAGQIARLQKRAGIQWAAYDSALRRLEELAAARPRQTLADLISTIRPTTATTAAPAALRLEATSAQP